MGQILTQEEVDTLLRGVTDGEIETGTDEVADPSGIVAYDLTSQERIIRGRMPTLEIIHQRFSRLFRSSLSTMVRRVVDVGLVSSDMIKFGDFLKGLPVPTSLHIFKIEPLRGFALLVLETKLVFHMVDVLFGGRGKERVRVEGREFTAIENSIIRKVVSKALEDLQAAWKPVYELNIEYSRSEVNPQFAGIVPPSDLVVMTNFEAELEESQGNISICLPYSAIEPIRQKLHTGFQSERLEVDHAWLQRLREKILEAEVETLVLLGRTSITPRELMALKKEDVLMLDGWATDELEALVEGVPKFRGVPGTYRRCRAFQITSLIQGRS
ncbi:MAG: flagellar motor switch protein FliM [Nitrospinota bacterium]